MKFDVSDDLLDIPINDADFDGEYIASDKFKRAIGFFKRKIVEERGFSTETDVSLFFSEANAYISNLEKTLSKIKKSYFDEQIKKEKSSCDQDNYWLYKLIQNWIGGPFAIAAVYFGGRFVYDNWGNVFGLLNSTALILAGWMLFSICIALIMVFSYALSYPFWISKKKKLHSEIDAKSRVPLDWMLHVSEDLNALRVILTDARNEAIQEVEYKKSMRAKRDDFELKNEFGRREIEDRLLIIKAENDAAIAASKSLEEQHERTAQIRLRYEREMVDISRQAASMNDASLMSKIEALKNMLGDDK